jgi:hydrogenase maturation protease
MTARTCVAGIGQKAAGDDGVAIAVLDELRRRHLPEGTELICLANPLDLVSLLEGEAHVVLVDAVLASPPGVVFELAPDELSRQASHSASSHGMSAAQAIELASGLMPNGTAPRLSIVAISIEQPIRYAFGLSPPVAAAVSEAADRVLSLLEVEHA